MSQNITTSRSSESGSLVTFLIVGVVLLALMSGIVYVAAQRAGTNDQPEDTEIAQQEDQEQEANQEQTDDKTSTEESGNGQDVQQESEDQVAEEESEPAEEDRQEDEEEASAPRQIAGADEEQDTDNTDQGSVQAPTTGPSDDLPETGPGEVLLSIASLAVLAYVIFRYAQSRNYHPVK